MALPGISNANEFYSAHYLESVLAGDIKKVRERWTEQAKAQLEAHHIVSWKHGVLGSDLLGVLVVEAQR